MINRIIEFSADNRLLVIFLALGLVLAGWWSMHNVALDAIPDLRRGVSDLDGMGEAVSGIIVMRQGENALDVIDRVKQRIRQIEPGLPRFLQPFEQRVVIHCLPAFHRAVSPARQRSQRICQVVAQ